MNPRVILLGFALLVGFAGCLGGSGTGTAPTATPSSPTPTTTTGPTPTTADGSAVVTTSGARTTNPPTPPPAVGDGNVTVEYVVRAGEMPEEVASATVTLAVAFAEDNVYHCDGDMRSAGGPGFGTPTQTPVLDHDLDCVRYGNLTVDLATLDGPRSLGRYSVPASATAEYALVVRDVTVTLENGTTVEGVYAEHFRAHTAHHARSGTVGVEIDVDRRPDDATPRPHRGRHADSPYETGSSEFTPDDVESPVRYRLATGGTVGENEQLTVLVTRDGAPAEIALDVVGAAEDRYHTGPRGIAAVDITDPDIVEVEVKTGED